MGGVASFFEDLWDDIKSLYEIIKALVKGFEKLDDTPIDWIEAILSSLFGPMGHLYLRIRRLNGSLDKEWLFIPSSYIFLGDIPIIGYLIKKIPMLGMVLSYLPTSLFANILLYGEYAANGKGTSVYDWWILLPIGFKFIISAILIGITHITNSKLKIFFFQIFGMILEFGIILIPNIIRVINDCNITTNTPGPNTPDTSWNKILNYWDSAKKLNSRQWNKIFMDSFILLGSAYSFPYILKPYLNKLRFINKTGYEMAHTITWSIGYTCMYMLLNMVNQNDINQYCNDPNYFMNTITTDNGTTTWEKITEKITLYNIFVIMAICGIVYRLYDYHKYDIYHFVDTKILDIPNTNQDTNQDTGSDNGPDTGPDNRPDTGPDTDSG